MTGKRKSLRLVKPGARAVIPPAQEYLWSAADIERHERTYWRAPKRLATDGTLARVWDDGSGRGCPSASSLLPVLALHAWPEAGQDWTPWTFLSRRRLAALAGLDKGTIAAGFGRLEQLGLVEARRVKPHPRDGGQPRCEFRLHRQLYPTGDKDPWFQLRGRVIYAGAWGLLPRASARQLLLAIGLLDPIHNEPALREQIEEDHEDRDVEARIARLRADSPASIGQLAEVSGLSGSTVQEALAILMTPIFDGNKLALVSTGEGAHGRYYFPIARAMTWGWNADTLNSEQMRKQIRQERWGAILRRAA